MKLQIVSDINATQKRKNEIDKHFLKLNLAPPCTNSLYTSSSCTAERPQVNASKVHHCRPEALSAP